MTPLEALAGRLERGGEGPPATAKRAAVLVLVEERPGGDLGFVYTRRREDLRHHPGQVSFPGGRVEPGEREEDAALREASEEIGLENGSVTVLGRLATFYLPPSRYWMTPVVARWDAPHPLRAEPGEVAEIISVALSRLVDVQVLRAVHLSVVGWSWAWQLDERHLLWGATGRVTEDLLSRLGVGWPPVPHPSALPDSRHVEPWLERPPPTPPSIDWLPRVGVEETAAALPATDRRWAPGTAEVVARLADSRRVVVVHSRVTAARGALQEALRGIGVVAAGVDVSDPAAGERLAALLAAGPSLVVDAMGDRAGPAPLTRGELALAERMRAHAPRVVALDVPSGLHGRHGLVGEMLTADVTVALGRPAPALWLPGIEVFTGDVVVVTRDGPAVVDRSPDLDAVRRDMKTNGSPPPA